MDLWYVEHFSTSFITPPKTSMKLHFAHTFGCQEKTWAQVSVVSAEFDPEEEHQALQTGWLLGLPHWYQSRSTRIRCQDYTSIRSWPKGYKFVVGVYSDFPHKELLRIYKCYIRNCGYTDYCNPLVDHLENSRFGVVYNEYGMMVAFTKFYMYQGGIESAIFCWDYSNPKVSLGIAIQTKEVEFAREQGMEYLYLGPGYEVSSIYKSRFPGFEWWTGKEWCTDIPQYVQLCQRDTEMKQHIHFDKIDPTVFDPDYKELDLTATP